MSKIAIAAKTDRTDVALALRKVLPNASIADLKQSLATGRPFFEMLFGDPDHDEQEAIVRKLVGELQRVGVEPIVYELGEMQSADEPGVEPESVEYLMNRFAQWKQIGDQFDDLEKEGHR